MHRMTIIAFSLVSFNCSARMQPSPRVGTEEFCSWLTHCSSKANTQAGAHTQLTEGWRREVRPQHHCLSALVLSFWRNRWCMRKEANRNSHCKTFHTAKNIYIRKDFQTAWAPERQYEQGFRFRCLKSGLDHSHLCNSMVLRNVL